MTNKLIQITFISAFLMLLFSCEPTEINIENPTTYSFNRNGETTVNFEGQTTRLQMAEELNSLFLDFTSSEATALEMYYNESATGEDVTPFSSTELNNSTKSIHSKVAASDELFSTNTTESATIKARLAEFVTLQYSEIHPYNNQLAEEGIGGQLTDGSSVRYVDSKGIEYNQLFAKSLLGALALDQTINNYLSPNVLDAGNNIQENDDKTVVEGESYTNMEHKWDEAYGYVFGLSSNPNDPLISLGEGSFLNKYLQRVNSNEEFSTIANDIWQAFKLGRAAIVAGDYEVRDEQAEIISSKLSDVVGVRAIYYLQAGKTDLAAENYGSAFHALSEGYGFIYSLRFTKNSEGTNLFSESDVADLLDILDKDNGFWSVTSEELDALSESIASKFDFTVEQASK